METIFSELKSVLVQQLNTGLGGLIAEVSRSHTDRHTR